MTPLRIALTMVIHFSSDKLIAGLLISVPWFSAMIVLSETGKVTEA